jgi:hypothetical protein
VVVADTNSNGDLSDPISIAVYKEIVDTLDFEKKNSTMSPSKLPIARYSRKSLQNLWFALGPVLVRLGGKVRRWLGSFTDCFSQGKLSRLQLLGKGS